MLGDSIRRARIESGMSQEQLAERLGVSRQSISLWETNQTRPTAENIISIAKILGVSTDDLLLDENKIWSKSSYKETEELDGEQKAMPPIYKKYIAIIIAFAVLILLIGIGIGFLMGRDRSKDDVSPKETQSETIKDKESTREKDEADKDASESEENVNQTNGQTLGNNNGAMTEGSTQAKEKNTEKQTTKKDSATEKTTKATTTAKKELTADEVAVIIKNATSKITDDRVGYSFTRTCELTEEPDFASKDALNGIVGKVSEGKTVDDVIGEILNTGTYSESVWSGVTPSNPTYALLAAKIKGEDITGFEVSGNTYTLYLKDSSNPVRTGNVPLSRMTHSFITQEDINNYISQRISSVKVESYSSENTGIKVTAKINGNELNELEISYNTASTMNIKAVFLHLKGQVNYNTSIRYYDFLF